MAAYESMTTQPLDKMSQGKATDAQADFR